MTDYPLCAPPIQTITRRRPWSLRRPGWAFLCVVLSLSWACKGRENGQDSESAAVPEIPQPGGTFRWNEIDEPRTLDPLRMGEVVSHHLGQQLYNGLVTFRFGKGQVELVPELAERWELSPDGLTFTFHLRRGVRFHDAPAFPGGRGRELEAADVKYSLERIAHATLASTGWWAFQGKVQGTDEFHAGKAQEVSGFQVLDRSTFRIRLVQPFAPFLYLLALPYGYVVPREAVEYYGQEFGRHPVGTGPFRLVGWSEGGAVTLERNPHYWERDEGGRPLPYLDRLITSFFKDSRIEFLHFQRGELETLFPIPVELWETIFTPDRKLKPDFQRYRVSSSPALDFQYYGFYLEASPFQGNKALRQALNFAVDREKTIRFVTRRNVPARGVLPPGLPGFNPDLRGYTYNPMTARALLAQAGYPEGQGLPVLTLQLNSGGTVNEQIAEVIQAQLAQVGVRVKIQLFPWPQHLERVEHGKANFFRAGWVADYPEAENFLGLFYGKNLSPGGPNYTHFRSARFDSLYQVAMQTYHEPERTRLYQEMEALIVEEAPCLFLWHNEHVRLIQPYVQNYDPNPLDWRVLKRVWLSPTRPSVP